MIKVLNTPMLNEVLNSLKRTPKSISSKFLYDSIGCNLFQRITQTEEYYLTRSERDILSASTAKIIDIIREPKIDVIEIGPGDGSKAVLISQELTRNNQDFNFYGLDICEKALEELKTNFQSVHNRYGKRVEPHLLIGEFSQVRPLLRQTSGHRRLILFLGSSIGNMTFPEARKFLSDVTSALNEGDYFLVGFDVKKDTETLTRAYNDKQGLTAQFNLNLLARFNRELNANFVVNNFIHYEHYDQNLGAMTSYLVSKTDQDVRIGSEIISFKKEERILTEYSFKYSEEDIQSLIRDSGLYSIEHFKDANKLFACVLFRKGKSVSRSESLSKEFAWAT